MSLRLDSIDAQIVKLLHEDGRMAYAEIARRIGYVTERVVRHRIKRMLEEHVIRVSAVVNASAIGYSVTADVWVETDASATTELAAALTCMEQVSYLSYSTGDQNISMQVHATDLTELHQLVTEVIGKMPGVRRTTIIIIPVILKDVPSGNSSPGYCGLKGGDGNIRDCTP
jgi:Lrp/AsnC family transcriptional regulator for asnA, asnC and gidA